MGYVRLQPQTCLASLDLLILASDTDPVPEIHLPSTFDNIFSPDHYWLSNHLLETHSKKENQCPASLYKKMHKCGFYWNIM